MLLNNVQSHLVNTLTMKEQMTLEIAYNAQLVKRVQMEI